jgi:N-glycosylase/DNA lyase
MADTEKTVRSKMTEFEKAGTDEAGLFGEMSFCILTANFTAEGGMRIQREIGEGFKSLEEKELAKKLRSLGYRFPTSRAGYIVEDRTLCSDLGKMLKSFRGGSQAREWLVENVKGFGYKEASHFLRNIGFKDVAIIDRHILRFLNGMELLDLPNTLSKKQYLHVEKLLQAIADKLSITLSELDLYLWYIMTGKILK